MACDSLATGVTLTAPLVMRLRFGVLFLIDISVADIRRVLIALFRPSSAFSLDLF